MILNNEKVALYWFQAKTLNRFRGFFVFRKADDEGGLSPGKEDNAAGDKKDRKDINVLAWNQYKYITHYYSKLTWK